MKRIAAVLAPAAAALAITALVAPGANATTLHEGGADLAIKKLNVPRHVHPGQTFKINATGRNYGPGRAEPALALIVTGATTGTRSCGIGKYHIADGTDGAHCEAYQLLVRRNYNQQVTVTAGAKGSRITVTAFTYALDGDEDDPNPRNDSRTVTIRVR